ncbi:MAG: cytochrome c oxidase cbb3-type subunit [Gaiellaceae bacterium]|jgi:cytochrome c oxidase cbb3-type subunit 2/cytochrome c oxidase cbb3-type subunit I/II|nr:cytochrome c oxidase cbb3-type subunit [Gaiellaceae bacterium]MDX6543225.1 cytochrome c oxidase cbb3-type subunit [Gaiellaceae bacterium]
MADETENDAAAGSDATPALPRGWKRHPPERMLITPWVAGVGGLLAFFAVVFIVVYLPIHTFDPPPSADWAPLSTQAVDGRNLFASNNCYVCHSGYSRPQDVRESLYFLYPKVSQPGDFYGSDQSPNLLGTERTGPDLSQESGWHPDDWQRAHFYDPRFVDPMSLMPPMKSLFSDKQIEQLITYVETRSGKSGLLRYAGQLYAKHIVLANQGFPPAPIGFTAKNGKIVEGLPDDQMHPPKGQLEEAPNLSQIDRSYWLSSNPLPVTEQNLLRGKEVFLQRCVSCHGPLGDGKGPGAKFMSPPPADFTSADDACCGGDTGPGDFYYRILRGWTGTGMENFGERLSVDDIWRVVMFVKTIPNHTLRPNVIPEPKDYIVWQPSKELLAWLASRQKMAENPSFAKQTVTDPFMQEAIRVFPGLGPKDSFLINDGKTRLSLQDASTQIKGIYTMLLNKAWSDAKARGDKLPSESQKFVLPQVPGQQ